MEKGPLMEDLEKEVLEYKERFVEKKENVYKSEEQLEYVLPKEKRWLYEEPHQHQPNQQQPHQHQQPNQQQQEHQEMEYAYSRYGWEMKPKLR
jgi:hypothetical protein